MSIQVEEQAWCNTCKQMRPKERFHPSSSKRNGLQSRCKDCKNAYRVQNFPTRTNHLQTKYGITPEQYADMLFMQGGVCKICGRENGKYRLAVDHNHETGEVRGLLCSNCNTALGLLREDPQIFESAIAYLKGSK